MSTGNLNVVFLGTAELAARVLRTLGGASFVHLVAVVSQPDRPRGRQMKVEPTPVKKVALELDLPCWQPERAKDPHFISMIRQARPDLIVVAAYGQILPGSLLDVPPMGCVNVHTSLLPKYRGAAPIQWALVNGDKETGVTIMKMDEGMDTGPIIAQQSLPILEEDDGQTLHDRLAQAGGNLLVRCLPGFVSGEIRPERQPADAATYARKIVKEDGRIDWSQPARAIRNRVRGFHPWPGAYSYLPLNSEETLLKIRQAEIVDHSFPEPGKVVKVSKEGIVVACGEQSLRLVEVQKSGSKSMKVDAFLAGNEVVPGTYFSK